MTDLKTAFGNTSFYARSRTLDEFKADNTAYNKLLDRHQDDVQQGRLASSLQNTRGTKGRDRPVAAWFQGNSGIKIYTGENRLRARNGVMKALRSIAGTLHDWFSAPFTPAKVGERSRARAVLNAGQKFDKHINDMVSQLARKPHNAGEIVERSMRNIEKHAAKLKEKGGYDDAAIKKRIDVNIRESLHALHNANPRLATRVAQSFNGEAVKNHINSSIEERIAYKEQHLDLSNKTDRQLSFAADVADTATTAIEASAIDTSETPQPTIDPDGGPVILYKDMGMYSQLPPGSKTGTSADFDPVATSDDAVVFEPRDFAKMYPNAADGFAGRALSKEELAAARAEARKARQADAQLSIAPNDKPWETGLMEIEEEEEQQPTPSLSGKGHELAAAEPENASSPVNRNGIEEEVPLAPAGGKDVTNGKGFSVTGGPVAVLDDGRVFQLSAQVTLQEAEQLYGEDNVVSAFDYFDENVDYFDANANEEVAELDDWDKGVETDQDDFEDIPNETSVDDPAPSGSVDESDAPRASNIDPDGGPVICDVTSGKVVMQLDRGVTMEQANDEYTKLNGTWVAMTPSAFEQSPYSDD